MHLATATSLDIGVLARSNGALQTNLGIDRAMHDNRSQAQLAKINSCFSGLYHRRDMLRIGSISLAASALPPMLQRVAHAEPDSLRPTAESVIVLWMAGGVTHIDSFDPKPDAPIEVRGVLRDIPTRLPGVHFCETLPRLANVNQHLALVRSFSHDSDDHLLSQAYTLSGRKVAQSQLFSEPNIGSIAWHVLGPRNGLPGYIAVPGITRPGPPPHNLFVGGWLGNHLAPYALGGLPEEPDFTVGEKLADPPSRVDEDLQPESIVLSRGLENGRLDERVRLRDKLDRTLASLERQDTLLANDGQFENAVRLLNNPEIRRAFEVDREPGPIREAYGRTKIGGRCLQARRLVEAGARFILVDYGYDPDYGNVWDNHNAPVQNHPPIQKIAFRGYHLAGMDQAFAALISDLHDRGLLEKTLVVFLTEFGRTPVINANGGRDHWGRAGSIFFAGGGTKAGQVIGETDRTASRPLTHPYEPADVAATIYRALGIDSQSFIHDIQDRPRPILEHGTAMDEVLG